jgi:hypothetical protein
MKGRELIERFVRHAAHTIAKNRDTFVAQYFIKHPEVDPKDVILVYKSFSDGTVQFSIRRKGERILKEEED